ncbi:hypothetical protein J3E69DRAFT_331760 [Trichoderma sp. SZMC 28015]
MPKEYMKVVHAWYRIMIYQMCLRVGMVCVVVYLTLSEPLSRAGLSRESASMCKGSVCFLSFVSVALMCYPSFVLVQT